MKYIKTFEHIKNFETNPNGTTFIQNIKDLQHFDKLEDLDRILKMIDDNPQYVNYFQKNNYFSSPINETILCLHNKRFVTIILKKLIENGADVNQISYASPLYNAVTTDKLDIVKILVENNANLEQHSGSLNTTPLMLAIMRYKNGNKIAISIIEYLLEKNANWFYCEPNLTIDIKDLLDSKTYNRLIEKYPKQYQKSLIKLKAKKYNI